MALGSNTLRTSLLFLLQVMTDHLMLWFQPISYLFSHFLFEGSADVEILPWLLQLLVPLHLPHHLHILLPLKMSLFSSLWMKCGHSLCDRLSSAAAYLWTAPPLRALQHSISVSTSITSILTTWVVSYACMWTHLHFIYCIVFFYSRLYGWLLCFWFIYLFWMIWICFDYLFWMIWICFDYLFWYDMDLFWYDMDLFRLFVMDYMDFFMLMDIFFTNVLVLRLWWLIGRAFILFDDEGGE